MLCDIEYFKIFGIDHNALEKQLSLPIETNPNGRLPLFKLEEVEIQNH